MENKSTTRLYFSGEFPIENHMREHPEIFDNCGIMLTFFILRQSEVAQPARRLRGMIRNKPCQSRTKGKKEDEEAIVD
jgi:hypothetical protein